MVTQPTFAPVPASGTVRPTMKTATPELARTPKPGLQRSAHLVVGQGQGTQAPGEGYALTIAQREVAKLTFEHEHYRHDVVIGVALLAAKRASNVGRAPQLGDVQVAMEIFALRADTTIGHELAKPFVGIAHSYVAQRKFVDAIHVNDLIAPPAPLGTL
jgi:hypothetical protein